jgi:multiple antibiotic resistance protein
MVDDFNVPVLEFLRLFFVINPLVLIPIFSEILGKTDNKEKRLIYILGAILVAFVTLLLFAFFGTKILKYIGISTNSFSIAGGILLIIIGTMMMVTGKPSIPPPSNNTGQKESKELIEPGAWFVPMGIPYIAGPGAITYTILMAQNDTSIVYNIPLYTSAIIATALFISLCLLIFFNLFSDLLMARLNLGKEVTTYLNMGVAKVMGMFITAIAVEFIINGILGIIHTP